MRWMCKPPGYCYWRTILFALAVLPLLAYGDDMTFGPLTLAQAEQFALINNPEVRAARAANNGATADVVTAGEAPNPQLSLSSTGANFTQGISSAWQWNKSVDAVMRLDQPIERGNKRGLRVQVAKSAAAAAAWDVTATLRAARQQVATTYFDLKYAQEAVAIYAEMLKLQQQSLQAAQLQLNAGALSAIDVARLKIEVVRAQAELASAELARTNAQSALLKVLGSAVDGAQLQATDAWPDIVVTNPVAPTAMRAQRPELRAAQLRMQQAEQALALARAQRSSDISVGLQYEHNLTGSTAPNAWSVAVSVPLQLRNRYAGEIARAIADRDAAADALQRLNDAATVQLQQAAAELHAAALRLQSYQGEVLQQAQAAADAAEYAFLRGSAALTDALDARRTLRAINLDVLDARDVYAKALADWRAITASEGELAAQLNEGSTS